MTLKEKPILFNSEMVRAILEGRKTETRRIIKEFPVSGYRWGGWIMEGFKKKDNGKATVVPENNSQYDCSGWIGKHCPYGQVGDRLWVRETFQQVPTAYESYHVYAADYNDTEYNHLKPWTPSIFMPRIFSRITLEITEIKVERVQDITEEGAKAEGVNPVFNPDLGPTNQAYINCFSRLWYDINEKRGFGWESNCWVWVVKFRRLTDGK